MSYFEDEQVTLHRLITEPYENNVWIVVCRATAEAAIIDAAGEGDRIVYAIKPYKPRAILTTHGHFDHIGAARQVADALSIPFRLHPEDAGMAEMEPDEALTDNEEIRVGELTLTVLHTPGHTPGSVCFVLPVGEGGDLLFSGDTLFPGGPGATRWDYSDFDTIMQSLDMRLFVMDDSTHILPGHGEASTIGAERGEIEDWRARGW